MTTPARWMNERFGVKHFGIAALLSLRLQSVLVSLEIDHEQVILHLQSWNYPYNSCIRP